MSAARACASRGGGVRNGEAAAEREPDAATGVGDQRPMPLHRVDREQTVRHAVFAHLALGHLTAEKRLPIDAQHAIDRVQPQRSRLVHGQAEDRFAQGGRPPARAQLAVLHERQSIGRAGPEDAARTHEDRIDVVGRQSVACRVGAPFATRKCAEPARRREPDRSVGAFGDRRDGIGGQAARRRERGDGPIHDPARARAQRARPERAVAGERHSVDTVLRKPFGLRDPHGRPSSSPPAADA